jgi:hypothetical protein
MDFVLPVMACLALGAPIGLAGAALIGHGPEIMSGLFAGYRGLDWPRGVQEEDPPGGWTWHLPPSQPSSPPSSLTSNDSAEAPATSHQPGEALVSEDPLPIGDRPILRQVNAQVGRGTSRLHSRW